MINIDQQIAPAQGLPGTGLSRRSFMRGTIASAAAMSGAAASLLALPAHECLAAAPTRIRLPSTRGLWLYNKNTEESLRVAHVIKGYYDLRALQRLDWLMRDHHQQRYMPMARKLYDILYVLQQRYGPDRPIVVTSGFRTERTNRMLAEKVPGVASHSLHLVAQAVDFQIPEFQPRSIYSFLNALGIGGVGRYPAHVHVDVGRVRHWVQA